MRILILLLTVLVLNKGVKAQELYPFSEPASNMPANSVALKLGSMLGKGAHSNRILQRYSPELQLGINKNLMIHGTITVSDMHEEKFIFESARIYTKYRFLSLDEVHKHFRMAAFIQGAYSRNHLDHNELNLNGDQSGIQAGVIATQLWNKLAVSATVSIVELLDNERWEKSVPQQYAYEALNYSLSAGYLVLPVEYKNYNQTNLNLYLELLGSRNLDWRYEKQYIDLAPSVQFIFKSTSKLNIGYRFQINSDIYRLMDNSFMLSYEYLFLNALKKKNKKP